MDWGAGHYMFSTVWRPTEGWGPRQRRVGFEPARRLARGPRRGAVGESSLPLDPPYYMSKPEIPV